MNFFKKFIAIVVPGILLSAPAFAHGGGMILIFIGLPLLAAMFLFYLIGSLYAAPSSKRFTTFIHSLFIGALWLAIFIGPWFQYQFESFLRNYEGTWAIVIPLLLFISSWVLRKRLRKNHT